MLARTDTSDLKRSKLIIKPDFIASSVIDINFKHLKAQGIKACFIDLDGTVVGQKTYEVDRQIITKLRAQSLPIYIATNRPRNRDLKDLKNKLVAQGVIHPHGLLGKPWRGYYLKAVKEYGFKPYEVVMIGDRYIQDIIGANSAGLRSLVVCKVGTPQGRFDVVLSKIELKLTSLFASKYLST